MKASKVKLLLIVLAFVSAFFFYTIINRFSNFEQAILETNENPETSLHVSPKPSSTMIDVSKNIYVDCDSVVAVFGLNDSSSFLVVKREPDESSLPVSCEAYIDFQNGIMGFYRASIPQERKRESCLEVPINIQITQGHQYTVHFIKEDGERIKLRLTNDCTGESDSIETNTSIAGLGWGKRSIECVSGSIALYDFYNISTQPYYSKVLIIGDSFVEGYSLGINKDARYAKRIKDELNGDAFINGQGGATSNDGLMWINTYLMDIVHPEYAIIAFGINESDYDVWKSNMKRIINELEKRSVIPILVTITPSQGEGVDNEVHMKMNEYIRKTGYMYIDAAYALSLNNDGRTFDQSKFLDDKVHPTIEGYDSIFQQAHTDVPELFK